jgi:hydrogenase/urease accessory protein HupE
MTAAALAAAITGAYVALAFANRPFAESVAIFYVLALAILMVGQRLLRRR